MNKNILEFVKVLTKNDKKTLSQKALKGAEEIGELAKAILPYDGAAGTLHRFTNKENILEEVADTMLVLLSIAYEIGASDDELEEMLHEKATVWQKIQAKEGKAEFPLPYEIHVTVKIPGTIEIFKDVCESIGVKPIVLDLAIAEGKLLDVMTSSVHYGDNRSAYLEMKRISTALIQNGFIIEREKVETVPWHPAAPTGDGKMPEGSYFEAHINCLVNEDSDRTLKSIIKAFTPTVHLSKNYFKQLEDGRFVRMITLRLNNCNYECFENHLNDLKNILKGNIEYTKVITEFAIYDTKISHDDNWIQK
jgi:NTP pyrophosphatase (non-canonical NTP hydrolase)